MCEIRPVAWLPTPEELEQLQVLLMRLENSRLDAQTRQEIEGHRQDLHARIQVVKKRLHAHVEQHETLKEHCALLISLPGIAELSAARRLSEIVDIKRFKTVKQLVAHAGLAPGERSSGISVHGKAFIGKAGRSKLRKSLYMVYGILKTEEVYDTRESLPQDSCHGCCAMGVVT